MLAFDDLRSQRLLAGKFVLALIWLMVGIVVSTRFAIAGDALRVGIGAVACAVGATVVWKLFGEKLIGRMLAGVALMAQISVLLAAASGHPWQSDLHMAYFAGLAVLIIYGDWKVIFVAAATVAIHHLLMTLVLPSVVFPDSANLGRVILHAVILIVEASTLMWVTANLNTMFAVSSCALEQAREAVARAEGANAAAAAARLAGEKTEQQAKLVEGQTLDRERSIVVSSIGSAMQALMRGDLTYRMTQNLPGEYAKLRDDFNAALSQFKTIIGSITKSTGGLRHISATIMDSSGGLSDRTAKQVSALDETAAALQDITVTAKRSAEGAMRVAAAARDAKTDALRSGTVMQEAVSAMSRIEQSSGQITRIIGVIDEIAFQTNLLALNAGVEAARAGDSGRGFAVVAQEVRGLAQRSASAAKEIKALIDGSSAEVERGVRLVGETGQSLTGILERVAVIDTLISDIERSSQDQAKGIEGLGRSVEQMDKANRQNVIMVEEAGKSASALSDEAETLATLVGRFEIGASPGRQGQRSPSRVRAA